MSQLSADRIAYAINVLRPDWGVVSLTTLISELRRPLPDCAIALTVVALDDTSTTPGRVRELGPWWNAAHAAGQPQTATGVPTRTDQRCAVEGHEHELAGHCRICRSEAIALLEGCRACGSDNVRLDPTDGWTCNACGATDADE